MSDRFKEKLSNMTPVDVLMGALHGSVYIGLEDPKRVDTNKIKKEIKMEDKTV